jgi:hypothetical protein
MTRLHVRAFNKGPGQDGEGVRLFGANLDAAERLISGLKLGQGGHLA